MANQVAPATVRDHRSSLERFLAFCGSKRLDTLTVAICERYFAGRLKSVRPATANKDRRTLQAIFQRAVTRGYLSENPWTKVKPVREPEKTLRVLTQEEVETLLDAMDGLDFEEREKKRGR